MIILGCVDMCVCVGFSWSAAREVCAEDHRTLAHYLLCLTITISFLGDKEQTPWCPRELGEESCAVHTGPCVIRTDVIQQLQRPKEPCPVKMGIGGVEPGRGIGTVTFGVMVLAGLRRVCAIH